ncbi:MAG TPA: SdpI family protein [Pyrinomonadaceae bacterium]|nr:SdpI family protein [Pyrinomonadaceae bacterium]
MMIPAILMVAGGLVVFTSCQPLIRRKIPMNWFYGIRIPAAFESPERWYSINEFGGRKLANWSWLITAFGVIGLFMPQHLLTAYTIAIAPVTLIGAGVPVMQVWLWARKNKRY